MRAFLRKLRRKAVTCWCCAYPFPHRCGGGRCSGSDWARSYIEFEGLECQSCLLYRTHVECEVSVGQERIKYCAGYRDHLKNKPGKRHPFLFPFEEEPYQFVADYDPDFIPF